MNQEQSEGRFRRGLFVMLVTVGLLTAGSLLYAKDSHDSVADARHRAGVLQVQNERLMRAQALLLHDQAVLLQMQSRNDAMAVERSAQASVERAQLTSRIARLEGYIAQLLSQSTDPVVSRAYSPQPAPQPSPDSTRPTHRPTPSPSPGQPTPTPSCSLSVRGRCLVFH